MSLQTLVSENDLLKSLPEPLHKTEPRVPSSWWPLHLSLLSWALCPFFPMSMIAERLKRQSREALVALYAYTYGTQEQEQSTADLIKALNSYYHGMRRLQGHPHKRRTFLSLLQSMTYILNTPLKQCEQVDYYYRENSY